MSSPLKQGNYRAAPQQRRPHRDRDGSWSDAATVLLPWSLAALVCLSCSFIVYSYRSSYISAYDSYNRGESEKKDFSRSLETLREAVTLVKDRDELFGEDEDDDDEDLEVEDRRNEATDIKIQRLQKYIQSESHRELVDSIGEGPYSVTITVILPSLPDGSKGDPSNEEGRTHNFVMEMAPMNMMPHSTHLFLMQVKHGLWDGRAFTINTGARIETSALTINGKIKGSALQEFKNAELDTVSFQEYNEDYPHEQYTIGFYGRPGGPDWYINTEDNTEAHGPGGKYGQLLEHEADPCFARIKRGHHVIQMMKRLSTSSGHFIESPIIKSATIQARV